MPNVKSMGDFKPAPTIREIPFPARVAFSIVNLVGSNSSVCLRRWPNGEPLRDPGRRSFELDRDKEPRSLEEDLEPDLHSVPLRACFSEFPRADVVLDTGVSVAGVSAEERPVS